MTGQVALSRATSGNATKPMLEISDLTVRYGPITAVRGVSLEIHKGELVTLLGANGAGKSSTLKAVVGLVSTASGRVVFEGHDITSLRTESIVRRGITLVPEGRRIFSGLTVAENLRLGAASIARAQVCGIREEMLDMFPVLRSKLHALAGLLSGGEQQQLAIARGLMSRPRLLLLDEPSLGLAPRIVASVFELIAHLRDRGVTILLVEQNVDSALKVADRAYVMNVGRVQFSGATAELGATSIEEAYLGISRGRG